jgi:acetylglutamate kinase
MTRRARTRATAWVVKVGGREIAPGPGLADLARWVRRRVDEGIAPVLVHGGGEEVTDWLRRMHLATERVDGQRKTTAEVLPVVEGVLMGPVQVRLLQALGAAGVDALGTSGLGGRLVEAEFLDPARLGLVGRPRRVRVHLIEDLLQRGIVPVLAPLAAGPGGQVLNVNADLFAASVAGALKAPLVMITDVPGVRDGQGNYRASLDPAEVKALLEDGTASEGMIPKLTGALEALHGGSPWVGVGQLSLAPEGLLRGTGITLSPPAPFRGRPPFRPTRGLPSLFSPAASGSEGA